MFERLKNYPLINSTLLNKVEKHLQRLEVVSIEATFDQNNSEKTPLFSQSYCGFYSQGKEPRPDTVPKAEHNKDRCCTIL